MELLGCFEGHGEKRQRIMVHCHGIMKPSKNLRIGGERIWKRSVEEVNLIKVPLCTINIHNF
jgi:hypothetical protein